MSFAAGSLPAAFAVVASGHIGHCTDCRAKVAKAQSLGGAVLENVEPVALSQGAANNLLERLEAEDRKTREDAPALVSESVNDDVIPPIVASLLGIPFSEISWKRAGRGISSYQIDLGENAASKLFLMKIAAGRVVPEHGHTGHEVTLILSGAYTDECGRFARWDVADLDPDVEHQPVVEDNEDCICLVAVERPARFKDFLPRLFQPMVGI
jgi:putative transcriptional regulator